jgi:hypothetical protein
MSLSFSTDLIRASDRLEAWRYNAKQVCGDCRFQFPKIYAFHGQIERRKVAGLELTRFSSSPLSFSKFPAVSLRSDDRCCHHATGGCPAIFTEWYCGYPETAGYDSD